MSVSSLCKVAGTEPSGVQQSMEWAIMKDMAWDEKAELSAADACDRFDASSKQVAASFNK